MLLNETGSGWLRNGLAVLVDLLAAVPSVVYGLWGILVIVLGFGLIAVLSVLQIVQLFRKGDGS